MNSNSPTPDHEKLKALLANSFHTEEAADVPPLPDDLRDRIRDQYGKVPGADRSPTVERSASWFTRLSSLFAQPAFRGAAAALVLVAVAAVLLIPKGNDPVTEVPRGARDYTGVTIVLVGFDDGRAQAIAKEFDPEAVKIVPELTDQISPSGRTVVLDALANEIEGYTSAAAEPQIVPLPENPADIAAAVANLSLKLRK